MRETCDNCGRRVFWFRVHRVRFVYSLKNPRVSTTGTYCSWACALDAKEEAELSMLV